MAFLCLFINCFDDQETGWSLWNVCSLDHTVKTLLRLHVCYRFVETLRLCRSDELFSPGVSSTIVGFTLFRSVTLAHTATNNKTEVCMQCPYCWREKKKKKKGREKKKSIAGDSGARRRIVSCQNNILPSSPADRCGGLGTEGSLSPPLSRFFSPSLSACRSLQFNIYLREGTGATALTLNWFRHLGLCARAAEEGGRGGWNVESVRGKWWGTGKINEGE